MNTHRNQSTANNNVISSVGKFNACKIICKRISEPLGIETPDIDTNVVIIVIDINSPKLNMTPLIWAIKMVETAINNAVPSVFIDAPIGRIKRVIRESMPTVFSITRNDTGSVAALEL